MVSENNKPDFQITAWIIKVNILIIGFFLVLIFMYNINTRGLPPGLLGMFGVDSSTESIKVNVKPKSPTMQKVEGSATNN